jgi:hypothetical protein
MLLKLSLYSYSFATCIISLGEGLSPLFEQFKSPPSQNDLCQVCLKLALLFWRRFSNDPSPFLHFCDYLPFEEDMALYLNKFDFPLSKDNLYQV